MTRRFEPGRTDTPLSRDLDVYTISRLWYGPRRVTGFPGQARVRALSAACRKQFDVQGAFRRAQFSMDVGQRK